ncbi:hypothetical protein AVEN_76455-1, partial [Araneus ventricosus]
MEDGDQDEGAHNDLLSGTIE